MSRSPLPPTTTWDITNNIMENKTKQTNEQKNTQNKRKKQQ